MKFRRQIESGLSTSMLDTISCGLGGAILLLIVWVANVEARGSVTRSDQEGGIRSPSFELVVSAWLDRSDQNAWDVKLDVTRGPSPLGGSLPASNAYWDADNVSMPACPKKIRQIARRLHVGNARAAPLDAATIVMSGVPEERLCGCVITLSTSARTESRPCFAEGSRQIERIGPTYRFAKRRT